MSKHLLEPKKKLLRRISICCIVGFIVFAVAFYFLAGNQLQLRPSAGALEMREADSVTMELVAGSFVEQHFSTNMQYLESVSVKWGTGYRVNAGTVGMDLYKVETGELLMSGTFDASAITESGLTTITAEDPIEGLAGVPLMLSVYSRDGVAGSSVSPLMNSGEAAENMILVIMGTPVPGTLCISATGYEDHWLGTNYWEICGGLFFVLLMSLALMWDGQEKGRRSYVVGAVEAVQKYRFLIRQLVSRDFKTKYKRSVLGMFWSFLNPLMMMVVQYFIFSTLFQSDIPNYAAYLLIGIVCFNFFSEVCSLSLFAILGNASLITKVYMPKYIYPVTRVLSSVVNLAISLIPLIIVCLLTGVRFTPAAILAFFFLLCLILFSLGMALLLSAAMVFFRDTQFLWSVFSTIWMYATAIFYPETILPENLRFVLYVNPVYHFIKNIRVCILDGVSPDPLMYLLCLGIALAMVLLGGWIFKKSQDKFVLYL